MFSKTIKEDTAPSSVVIGNNNNWEEEDGPNGAEKNATRRKPKWCRNRQLRKCVICGMISEFRFYGVQSCESCKQFFRRVVVRKTEFMCHSNRNCDPEKKKCRGCRLDKCLKVGMDPNYIRAPRTDAIERFLNRLERRRDELLNLKSDYGMDEEEEKLRQLFAGKCHDQRLLLKSISALKLFSEHNREANQLQYFCHLLKAQRRIMDGFEELPHSFADKCQKIEDVLCGPENILGLHETFPANPKIFSAVELDKYYGEAGTLDSLAFHHGIRKTHGLFKLIQVGLFKAMIPAFNAVPFEDKVVLVRELGHQMTNFTKSYYSARKGARIMASQNGVAPIDILKAKYKNDRRLISLAEKVFVNSIDAFYRIHPMVEEEEFALLLAILCSNPAVSGLSEHAKELLYEEQVQYSRLLLQYNQLHLGGEKGARRYAECVHLIDSAFQAARHYELMTTYIEVFLRGNDFHAGIYPECLKGTPQMLSKQLYSICLLFLFPIFHSLIGPALSAGTDPTGSSYSGANPFAANPQEARPAYPPPPIVEGTLAHNSFTGGHVPSAPPISALWQGMGESSSIGSSSYQQLHRPNMYPQIENEHVAIPTAHPPPSYVPEPPIGPLSGYWTTPSQVHLPPVPDWFFPTSNIASAYTQAITCYQSIIVQTFQHTTTIRHSDQSEHIYTEIYTRYSARGQTCIVPAPRKFIRLFADSSLHPGMRGSEFTFAPNGNSISTAVYGGMWDAVNKFWEDHWKQQQQFAQQQQLQAVAASSSWENHPPWKPQQNAMDSYQANPQPAAQIPHKQQNYQEQEYDKQFIANNGKYDPMALLRPRHSGKFGNFYPFTQHQLDMDMKQVGMEQKYMLANSAWDLKLHGKLNENRDYKGDWPDFFNKYGLISRETILLNAFKGAFKGFKNSINPDSTDLIEILVTATNEEKRNLPCGDLAKHGDAKKEISGNYKILLLSLCNYAQRDTGFDVNLTEAQVKQEADWLHYYVQTNGMAQDEDSILRILTKYNYSQLRRIFLDYSHHHNGPFYKAVSYVKNDHYKQVVEAISIDVGRGRPYYFAKLLQEKIDKIFAKVLGTNNDAHNDMLRILLCRAPIDLADISAAYQEMFNYDLRTVLTQKTMALGGGKRSDKSLKRKLGVYLWIVENAVNL